MFDWSGKEEMVAEGRWESCDPKTLVNGIPLGPNAFSIWIDIPKKHEAFLWRPTSDMTYIEDAVNSTIAWPANKVVLEKIPEMVVDNATSPSVKKMFFSYTNIIINYVRSFVLNLYIFFCLTCC